MLRFFYKLERMYFTIAFSEASILIDDGQALVSSTTQACGYFFSRPIALCKAAPYDTFDLTGQFIGMTQSGMVGH